MQFILACFENKMFTIIRNGSLKWIVMRKNVKKTLIQMKILMLADIQYMNIGYFLNRVDLWNLNQITEYKKLQIDQFKAKNTFLSTKKIWKEKKTILDHSSPNF